MNAFETIPLLLEKINERAESFLESYHSSDEIPIPIEEIIEFKLKMDIIPIPGLKEALRRDNLDIDGFISTDFKLNRTKLLLILKNLVIEGEH